MSKKDQSILTTGQIAKICKVCPRTVSGWFDQGLLKGYRIPRSHKAPETKGDGQKDGGDRRVFRTDLIEFMRARGMERLIPKTWTPVLVLVDVSISQEEVIRERCDKEEIKIDVQAFGGEHALDDVLIMMDRLKPVGVILGEHLATSEIESVLRTKKVLGITFVSGCLISEESGLTELTARSRGAFDVVLPASKFVLGDNLDVFIQATKEVKPSY